jgi:ethanolamine utilization protein EutN
MRTASFPTNRFIADTRQRIMRIAQIIGTVTLNRSHPSFPHVGLRLAVPLTLENLSGQEPPAADPLVVCDELGAGQGSKILMAEGPEAAQPFRPRICPVDAYNAGILDRVDLRLPNKTNSERGQESK